MEFRRVLFRSLQDGAVAVVGLKGENPPTLFQERKQCMAVARTHVDHDRPLQPAIEQFGYAIGLVVMRTLGPGERPDCPCLAHRVPDRKSGVSGKSVSVRVDLGGSSIFKK